MIHFTCKCGKTLKVADEFVGKRAKCPTCGQVTTVPAAHPPAYDCFISHSNVDRATAETLCAALEAGGIRCWIAPRDIRPGTEYGPAIIDGLNRCRVVVVVFSASADASPQVRREIERAGSKAMAIIPFRIENVPMSPALEFFLSSPHWLDATQPPLEPHLETLRKTVSSVLAEAGRAPAPRPSAPVPSPKSPAATGRNRRLMLVLGVVGGLAAITLGILAALGAFTSPRPTPPAPNPAASAALSEPSSAPKASTQQSPVPSKLPTLQSEPAAKTMAASATAEVIPAQPDQMGGVKPPVSEVALQGGKLMLRATGISVRYEPLLSGASKTPLANRLIVLSDHRDAKVRAGSIETTAEASFQINNSSDEVVTLTNLQLRLLGVISVFEDYVVEPQPPQLARLDDQPEMAVDYNASPASFPADARSFFTDTDTPPEDLRLSATSSSPELVAPTVDAQGNLRFAFGNGKSGVATVTVQATDPFGLAAKKDVRVTVREPPVAQGVGVEIPYVVHKGQQPEFGQSGEGTSSGYEPDGFGMGTPVDADATGLKTVTVAVDDKKEDLGAVAMVYEPKPGAVFEPCASGELFPPGETGVIAAKYAKSFTLHVAGLTTVPALAPKLPADALVGLTEPRRRLVAEMPRLVAARYVFTLSVHVTGKSGTSQDLYADRILTYDWDDDSTVRGKSETPDEFAQGLLEMAVRQHKETRVYRAATEWTGIPPGFDADAVSPWCYYACAASPFRGKSAPTSFTDRDRWPRSNLLGVLAALRKERSPVWALVDAELTRLLAAQADLGLKARYVQAAMRSDSSSLKTVPSFVRVEMPQTP